MLLGRKEQIQGKMEELRRRQEESIARREELLRDMEQANAMTQRERDAAEAAKEEQRQHLQAQVRTIQCNNSGRESLVLGVD